MPFWIREDDWGSDIQTLLLAAYGKSPSMPGTSPRLPAAPLHATPPPSLPACRAGLRSNYIWEDLVKGAASLKPWRLWYWVWLLGTTGLLSSLRFNHMKWPQREQQFHLITQVVEMITSSPGLHLNKKNVRASQACHGVSVTALLNFFKDSLFSSKTTSHIIIYHYIV